MAWSRVDPPNRAKTTVSLAVRGTPQSPALGRREAVRASGPVRSRNPRNRAKSTSSESSLSTVFECYLGNWIRQVTFCKHHGCFGRRSRRCRLIAARSLIEWVRSRRDGRTNINAARWTYLGRHQRVPRSGSKAVSVRKTRSSRSPMPPAWLRNVITWLIRPFCSVSNPKWKCLFRAAFIRSSRTKNNPHDSSLHYNLSVLPK
jgi:hypothetical protein